MVPEDRYVVTCTSFMKFTVWRTRTLRRFLKCILLDQHHFISCDHTTAWQCWDLQILEETDRDCDHFCFGPNVGWSNCFLCSCTAVIVINLGQTVLKAGFSVFILRPSPSLRNSNRFWSTCWIFYSDRCYKLHSCGWHYNIMVYYITVQQQQRTLHCSRLYL